MYYPTDNKNRGNKMKKFLILVLVISLLAGTLLAVLKITEDQAQMNQVLISQVQMFLKVLVVWQRLFLSQIRVTSMTNHLTKVLGKV